MQVNQEQEIKEKVNEEEENTLKEEHEYGQAKRVRESCSTL